MRRLLSWPARHGGHLLLHPLVQQFFQKALSGAQIKRRFPNLQHENYDMKLAKFFRAAKRTGFGTSYQGGHAGTKSGHADWTNMFDRGLSSVPVRPQDAFTAPPSLPARSTHPFSGHAASEKQCYVPLVGTGAREMRLLRIGQSSHRTPGEETRRCADTPPGRRLARGPETKQDGHLGAVAGDVVGLPA